jgi:hypothetical protein
VSKSALPRNQSFPQDGDVVVTRDAHARVHYTVRQLPGIAQFSATVRDEALRIARRFCQKYGVNVWYGEGGTYRLLEVYRPLASAAAPVSQVDDDVSRGRR